jgi:hypothetical protein
LRAKASHGTIAFVSDPRSPDDSTLGEGREIVISHALGAGPVTAVRNVLIQASLTQLQDNGYYARYTKVLDKEVLQLLLASIGPGWTPLTLADAHYAACDAMNLSSEEILKMGTRVGGRVQETLLVSASRAPPRADFDLWAEAVAPLNRVWPRLYQGGSVQIVKLGPKIEQVEFRGFGLVRHRYYRHATASAMSATHAAMGALIESAKIISYDAALGELAIRLSWA